MTELVKTFLDSMFLDYEEKYYMSSISKEELLKWNTDKLIVISAHIGTDIRSIWYGKILGYFEYDNKVYHFFYHIHEPNQKYPQLSNKMTCISVLIEKQVVFRCEEVIPYVSIEDSTFGHKAFWLHTPDDYIASGMSLNLPQEEIDECLNLRHLMRSITAYSRSKVLCKYFRSLDKNRLKYEEQFNTTMKSNKGN